VGEPVAGDVVILPFPHTDLSVGKRRPALVLVTLPGDDLILCQITSQPRADGFSLPLAATDFAQGGLQLTSYLRPQRLFTVDRRVVLYTAGRLQPAKLTEVLARVRAIFGEQ
jgi:mRNA interferase MazF